LALFLLPEGFREAIKVLTFLVGQAGLVEAGAVLSVVEVEEWMEQTEPGVTAAERAASAREAQPGNLASKLERYTLAAVEQRLMEPEVPEAAERLAQIA